ncbi:MAG: dockerin type I repeat-containing protein [Ruminococcus flavefaciens]|nr:dockerin type I repeat-containing protein [Ruminococcus flavefaciens]
MKRFSFISILISIMLCLVPCFNITHAETEDTLLKCYVDYTNDSDIIDLDCKSTGSTSAYKITVKSPDYMKVIFSTDKELTISTDYFQKYKDRVSISSYFSAIYKKQTLTVNFLSKDSESNRVIAQNLYNSIKEDYNIIHAYACFDANPISRNYNINWNILYKYDEFGYTTSPKEELTKNQINNIKDSINDNNFSATIDDNGKITFDSSASEVEKFRFAFWLKEEYGFEVTIVSNSIFITPKYNLVDILHYTDLEGDVNNDNVIDISDIEMLRDYLLTGMYNTDTSRPYVCFNTKNADLTGDGVIDVFDLVLLRQQVISYYN